MLVVCDWKKPKRLISKAFWSRRTNKQKKSRTMMIKKDVTVLKRGMDFHAITQKGLPLPAAVSSFMGTDPLSAGSSAEVPTRKSTM